MSVQVLRLPHARDLPIPSYATEGSAGLDLLAAIAGDIELAPGARRAVPCGIALAMPEGYEGQVRPRSGLALNHGITLLNAPGTIDSDYRGEVMVLLINLGDEDFEIIRGMRIAQMIIAPVTRAAIDERSLASETSRGDGGFGSTGTK